LILRKKRYDLTVDLSLGYQISFLLMLAGAKKRIGYNYRNRGRFLTDKLDIEGFHDKHVSEYDLDFLKLIGLERNLKSGLEFDISAEDNHWADGVLKDRGLDKMTLIGIAPGGGKSWGDNAIYRTWGSKNFSYVAAELAKKHNVFFILFGSGDDRPLCDTIEKDIPDKAVNLCGNLSIEQSAALIGKCALLICNDSGILHIAVSRGVKTISIFGPVDDRVYGPYPPSGNHKAVVAEGVLCRPCYRNFRHTSCGHRACLEKINKEKVIEAAEEMLAKK